MSNKNFIFDNICSANGDSGIVVGGWTGENLVRRNLCRSNDRHGISVGYSVLTEVSENICTENGRDGIILGRCDITLISENQVTFNQEIGISIWESDDDKVFNNSLDQNEYAGIEVRYSQGIHIENNSISKSKYGIRMVYPDKDSGRWEEGPENYIMNNTFEDNEYNMKTIHEQHWSRNELCLIWIVVFLGIVALIGGLWQREAIADQLKKLDTRTSNEK